MTVPRDFSVSVGRGEFEGGGTRTGGFTRPPAVAAQRLLAQKTVPRRLKTAPRRLLGVFFQSSFCHPFSDAIFSRFGSILPPSWLPKSDKIEEKSMPGCLSRVALFFECFFIGFYLIFDTQSL